MQIPSAVGQIYILDNIYPDRHSDNPQPMILCTDTRSEVSVQMCVIVRIMK